MLDDVMPPESAMAVLERRAKGLEEPEIPETPSPESMGKQIRAMALGVEHLQYVNTPNVGAVPNLPDWAVLDLKCVIGSHGARPLHVGELPPQAARWSLVHVYAHELVADAAVEGSRQKALQALACDSMTLNFNEVEPVFDAIVEAQGPRLARFRKRRK
jgi:alpha-galactosidase